MTSIEYNFHLMDSVEFEKLAVTVIRHQHKIPLEMFSPGPDGGRDAAARGVDITFKDGLLVCKKNVVVQVKHTGDPTAKVDNNVRKKVFEKKEGCKVGKLAKHKEVDVYFLISNYALPAGQEEQLHKFFKKKGAKHVVVIGKETLTSMISDHQELRSIVPVKYGVGDLTRLSNYNSEMLNSEQLKYHEELLKPFVSTKAYEQIQKLVFNSKKNVIIRGGPHSGKSTILRKLGSDVGSYVGSDVGSDAGSNVGSHVGSDVGSNVGSHVGSDVGSNVGSDVGSDVGSNVGSHFGSDVGSNIGSHVGTDAKQPKAYYNACFCTDWDEFQKLRLTSEKQLFLIDDVFGCATVDKRRLNQWNYKCFQLGAACFIESSVVITSRKSVYESALSMASEDFKEFLESSECVSLDDQDVALDYNEKLDILHNCIEHGDHTPEDKDKLETILKDGDLDQLVEGIYPSFLLAAKRMGQARYCTVLSSQGVKELFGKYGKFEESEAPSPIASSRSNSESGESGESDENGQTGESTKSSDSIESGGSTGDPSKI